MGLIHSLIHGKLSNNRIFYVQSRCEIQPSQGVHIQHMRHAI